MYIVVQYLPILLIPVMLILFPVNAGRDRMYWILLLAYILAKMFEMQDDALFNQTHQLISGHSMKHLAAAAAILALYPYDDEPREVHSAKE